MLATYLVRNHCTPQVLINRSTGRLRLLATSKDIHVPRWDDGSTDRKRDVSTGAYLLGEPLPGRRHPVKAASRDASGARCAPALRGWRRSGPMATSK
jgi:hypothetical protein